MKYYSRDKKSQYGMLFYFITRLQNIKKLFYQSSYMPWCTIASQLFSVSWTMWCSHQVCDYLILAYRIAENVGGGNFGRFGERNTIRQYFTQPNSRFTTVRKFANIFPLCNDWFTKVLPCHNFPLYGILLKGQNYL